MVLDRADPNRTEACVVTSASGDTLTLEAVQFAHASGALLEFGLTLREEVGLRGDTAHVRARPLARILSVAGTYRSRYAPGIEPLPAFNTTPWTAFTTGQCDIDPAAGTCRLVPSNSPAGFTRVRLHLVAGWTQANLPYAIKQAVADAVRNMTDLSDSPFGGNTKLLKAGDSTIERFAPGALAPETMALLAPYRSYRV